MLRPVHRLLARLPRPARRLVYTPGRVARGAWDEFVEWFNGLDLSENAILLAFAVVVGAAAALGVVAFYKLIDLAYLLFFQWPRGWLPAESPWFVRPVVTGAALLSAWWIMSRFAPGEEGMHVADVQRRVVRAGGRIPARPAVVRTTAAAVTLGGGGSVGSEGPVAVLGAAAGSALGKAFRFGSERTTLLVAAGAAAAISAAFNAPLAGAFFALEEILVGLNVAAFPVVVVASVVAAVISRAVFGNHPAFPIPEEYSYGHVAEVIITYPLLGVVVGIMAAFFIAMSRRLAPTVVTPSRALMGGAIVGLMVAASGGLLVGTGHLAIPLDVFGTMAWWSIALLAIGKVIATAVTLGWGGSGGVFTPALYIGAATGGSVGAGFASLLPGLAIQPAAYGVVGMGAMVAAATGAPLTGILLVFEMTDDYALMLPLMMATAVAVVIARRLEPDDLYRGWLRRRGVHLEHGVDRDMLAGLTVADAITRDIVVVHEHELVDDLRRRFAFADQTVYPVVDELRRLVGLVTHRELAEGGPGMAVAGGSVTAHDISRATEAVTLDVPLADVARRLGTLGLAALPVVDAPSGRVLGTIGRDAIVSRYGRAITVRGTSHEGLGIGDRQENFP